MCNNATQSGNTPSATLSSFFTFHWQCFAQMGGSNFTGGRKQGQFSVFSAEISFVRHGMKEGCAGVGALRGSRNCAPVVNWDNSIRLVRWDIRAGSRIPGRRCARFPWDWDLHRVRGNRGGTMVMVMVGAEGAGRYSYNRLGAGCL